MSGDVTALVATLIAGKGAALGTELVSRIARGLASARVTPPVEGVAIDIFFDGGAADIPALSHEIRAALGDAPADVIVQPVAARRKAALLSDLESTLIEQEMLDVLAEAAGVADQAKAMTGAAMGGRLDFADALRRRVAMLKDLPRAALEDAARAITLMPGAEALLNAMKRQGAYAVMVTGGFADFAEPLARRLGFDECHANRFGIAEHRLDGTVMEPIFGPAQKRETLNAVCRTRNLPRSALLAIGDGANDIPMLQACNEGGGLGVAYHAKQAVRDAVCHQINHTDLAALAYAQGYVIPVHE